MVTAGVYLVARTIPLFWLDMMAGGGAGMLFEGSEEEEDSDEE